MSAPTPPLQEQPGELDELETQLFRDLKHTLKLVSQSQRDLFVFELARYLAPLLQTKSVKIKALIDRERLEAHAQMRLHVISIVKAEVDNPHGDVKKLAYEERERAWNDLKAIQGTKGEK